MKRDEKSISRHYIQLCNVDAHAFLCCFVSLSLQMSPSSFSAANFLTCLYHFVLYVSQLFKKREFSFFCVLFSLVFSRCLFFLLSSCQWLCSHGNVGPARLRAADFDFQESQPSVSLWSPSLMERNVYDVTTQSIRTYDRFSLHFIWSLWCQRPPFFRNFFISYDGYQ